MIAFLSRTARVASTGRGSGQPHPQPSAEPGAGARRRRARRGVARALCAGLLALAVGGAAGGEAPARAGAGTGITNGDFETGDLAGWYASGPVRVVAGSPRERYPADCHGGGWCASLTSTGALSRPFVAPYGAIGQTLTFWYQMRCDADEGHATLTDRTTSASQFQSLIAWGTCPSIVDIPWRQGRFNLIGSHAYELTLKGANLDHTLIDDVRVAPTSPLARYYAPVVGHWVTTGPVGAPYAKESTLGYVYAQSTGGFTRPLYGCLHGAADHFLSLRADCEGQQVLGGEGYVSPSAAAGTVALYRCYTGWDHFVSTDPACEGQKTESLLGYASKTAS